MSLTSFIPTTLAAAADPLGHVKDYHPFGGFTQIAGNDALPVIVGVGINTITLVVVTLLTVVLLLKAAARIQTGDESLGNERYITKGRFSQIFEVIVLYLRDNVIKPQLGSDTNRFLPLLLTVFFFILFNNLMGLVPLIDLQYFISTLTTGEQQKFIGGTATGRLGVNAALAIVVFLAWNAYGIKQNGLGGWLHHFTGGTPWFLWPVMIPVELMGLIVKPAALTVRLFANMTAGHILLGILIIFVAAAPRALYESGGTTMALLGGAPLAIVSFLGAIAIYFLEIFVAFLQAFIFMFLTAIFIGQMSHHHDEHEEHGHGEAPVPA